MRTSPTKLLAHFGFKASTEPNLTGQPLCAGTGKKASVTEPDQVTLAPGQSIQERIGFGLQQHSSGNAQGGPSQITSKAEGLLPGLLGLAVLKHTYS